MEVSLAVLADYANLAQDGKLNIMGIFQEVNPPVLPFALPQMYLVISLVAGPAEFDTTKDIKIALLDNDGNEITIPDLDALAKAQGVAPIGDIDELLADFWPEDESVEDFMTAVRRWRDEGSR